MAYADKQDMIDRIGESQLIELTDRVEPYQEAINDTVLDGALNDATAMINSYIAARYALPIISVPDVLKRHCCVLAVYYLHRGRHTDEVRKDYEDSISFLRGISKGEARLDIAGIEAPAPSSEARVQAQTRIFNRETMEGF